MRHRQLPRAWLFTDERLGEQLWVALARLPRGAGVVFRHYRLAPPARRALLARVRAVVRRRGLVLVVAAAGARAGEGRHLGVARSRRRYPGLVTAAAHNVRELVAARRCGAVLVFVSPVFASRSHPGAAPLGTLRFRRLARHAHARVAALGGMTAKRFRSLRPAAAAWGAIDAWQPA